MQVDYLFIIPLTPQSHLTSVRAELRKLCFTQLQKVDATKRVWLLGDLNELPDGFEHIELKATTKEDKLVETCGILKDSFLPPARYIVRIDDDDLINPGMFDRLSKADFDIAYDTHHAFYDLSSGWVSYQKRPWIANTSIHEFKHALARVEAFSGAKKAVEENFLIASDHSQAWHKYYESKKKLKLKKGDPLYIRVLNPNTRSAEKSNTSSSMEYANYLSQFGNWKGKFPFEPELNERLIGVWNDCNGALQKPKIPRKSKMAKIANLISSK